MASSRNIHIFNCDGLYDLRIVEDFLNEVQSNLPFKLSVHHHVFSIHEMRRLSEEIATIHMDYAVFVVHANESRLSINEKGAGIGYALIYTALQERTDDKVLIIIGGDDHYGGEEDRAVLSDWAKYKISSQFSQEYMDGRKSFIFSWKNQPNNIHYEAVKHFFLGEGVFQPPRPPRPPPVPNPPEERLYYFILKRNCRVVYEASPDGRWRPDPQKIEEIRQTTDNDCFVMFSNVDHQVGGVKETLYHSGSWRSWAPYLIQYYLPFTPNNSGQIRVTSLLVSGRMVSPSLAGSLPVNITADLERLYKNIPFAIVTVHEENNREVFFNAYYLGSRPDPWRSLLPQWV